MITGNEPIHGDNDYTNVGTGGLTIRQHFAATAMQAILSSSSKWLDKEEHYKCVSEMAVKYTNALIAELNKQK